MVDIVEITVAGPLAIVEIAVPGPVTVVEVSLPVMIDGGGGGGGSEQFFVQATQPSATGPYLWIQTGLAPAGSGFTFWFEDGI